MTSNIIASINLANPRESSRTIVADSALVASDLQDWADEVNSEHLAAFDCALTAIEHGKRAGSLLLKAKEAVGRGQWLTWLAANIKVSVRQAQRYMQLAEANTTRVSHTSMRQALAELAAPAEARPVQVASAALALGKHDARLGLTEHSPRTDESSGAFATSRDADVTSTTLNSAQQTDVIPAPDSDGARTCMHVQIPADGGGWDDEDEACHAIAEKEYAATLDRVLRATDAGVKADEEIKRLTALVGVLTCSRDQYMNGQRGVTDLLKKEKQLTAGLRQKLDKLKADNGALRKHIEILEGP